MDRIYTTENYVQDFQGEVDGHGSKDLKALP